jgi:hypothetical protein
MTSALLLFPTHDVVYAGGLNFLMSLVILLFWVHSNLLVGTLPFYISQKNIMKCVSILKNLKTRQLILLDQSFVPGHQLPEIMFIGKQNCFFTYSKFDFWSYKPWLLWYMTHKKAELFSEIMELPTTTQCKDRNILLQPLKPKSHQLNLLHTRAFNFTYMGNCTATLCWYFTWKCSKIT